MKKKAKILGIKVGVDGNLDDYFDGFYVMGYGYVDPNTDNYSELEDLCQDEILDWAHEQVGKFVFFDDIRPTAYITVGKTYIV